MIRGLARRSVEGLLGGALGVHLVRLRGRSLVLAYHNVVELPAQAGADSSLHVALERFRAHLDSLLRTHRVVSLDDLLDRPDHGGLRVALTFDDACRGTLRYAVPELARRGLPATLFVVPGRLGRAFWWDRLRGPAADLALFRDHVLTRLAGDDEAAVAAAPDWGLEVVDAPRESQAATEPELREALAHPGIALGSHTWSHRSLVALDGTDLAPELSRPLEWLESRFDPARVSRWVAYPYGLHDGRVERAVDAAGYRGGLRIDGGCLLASPGRAPVSRARVNVPAGLTSRGLRLRAAGLLAG